MLSVQVRRFLVSGVLATIVHFAVAVFVIEQLQAEPAFANAVAFTVATVFSYVINTLWSFGSTIHSRTLVRFITVQAVGVALAAAVSGMADWLGLHYLIGTALVPVFVTPVTFTLHRLWTYNTGTQSSFLSER